MATRKHNLSRSRAYRTRQRRRRRKGRTRRTLRRKSRKRRYRGGMHQSKSEGKSQSPMREGKGQVSEEDQLAQALTQMHGEEGAGDGDVEGDTRDSPRPRHRATFHGERPLEEWTAAQAKRRRTELALDILHGDPADSKEKTRLFLASNPSMPELVKLFSSLWQFVRHAPSMYSAGLEHNRANVANTRLVWRAIEERLVHSEDQEALLGYAVPEFRSTGVSAGVVRAVHGEGASGKQRADPYSFAAEKESKDPYYQLTKPSFHAKVHEALDTWDKFYYSQRPTRVPSKPLGNP